jgi:uncharacterized RDD family membrane protein YckC
MAKHSDFLSEEYTIDTPENVTFGYEVAGIGSRFIGALLDSTLLVVARVVVNLLLLLILDLLGTRPGAALSSGNGESVSWLGGLIIAAYALLNFGLLWGYFIVFELLWNGQTPGKRLAGIRVVRTDGNPAGLIEIVVRNLVRIVDFLPAGYGIGLIAMFCNRQARRLGDFAAGTLVIKERKDIALATLGPAGPVVAPDPEDAARVDALLLQYPAIRRLSAADYDLIQDALGRARQGVVGDALLARLAAAVAAKLACPAPAAGAARQFLDDVSLLYRRLRLV